MMSSVSLAHEVVTVAVCVLPAVPAVAKRSTSCDPVCTTVTVGSAETTAETGCCHVSVMSARFCRASDRQIVAVAPDCLIRTVAGWSTLTPPIGDDGAIQKLDPVNPSEG